MLPAMPLRRAVFFFFFYHDAPTFSLVRGAAHARTCRYAYSAVNGTCSATPLSPPPGAQHVVLLPSHENIDTDTMPAPRGAVRAPAVLSLC